MDTHSEDIDPVVFIDSVVRCDCCGNTLGSSATKPVTRVYNGKPFAEQWCLICIASVQEATDSAKSYQSNEEPEY